MSRGSVAVRLDPGDLGAEQLDALGQFVLRIGREVFGGELARGVAPGAGKIVEVHRAPASQAGRLAVNPTWG
jgi:hypothetical protein